MLASEASSPAIDSRTSGILRWASTAFIRSSSSRIRLSSCGMTGSMPAVIWPIAATPEYPSTMRLRSAASRRACSCRRCLMLLSSWPISSPAWLASFSSFAVIESTSRGPVLARASAPRRTGCRIDCRSASMLCSTKFDEPAQVIERLVVDQPLAVGLVHQVGVAVPADVDEADDLVVAQLLDRVVHPPLVQAEPVVVRLAVGPDAEAVPVDADPGPLAQPRPDLHAGPDPGQRLALQVEGEDADPDRPAGELARARSIAAPPPGGRSARS